MLNEEIKKYIKEIVKESLHEVLEERERLSSQSKAKYGKQTTQKRDILSVIRKEVYNYTLEELLSHIGIYLKYYQSITLPVEFNPDTLSRYRTRLEAELDNLKKEYQYQKKEAKEAGIVEDFDWVDMESDTLSKDDLIIIARLYSVVLANRSTNSFLSFMLEEHNKLNG